jgi:alkylhydroperoxidase family enzyme
VDGIAEDFEARALPDRYKLAIRLTDVIVTDPRGMTDELRDALLAELAPAQIVELALTTALASAFSKAAIAWGPPPHIPLLEVPTPTPGGSVT